MAIDVSVLRKDADLAATLDRGYTLPAEWYTEPAIFNLEQERIFRRFWQYVGHAEQVAEPGTFFTCRVGTVPILVVRDQQGELRAFANVCRHRGSQLVLDDRGRRKTLQCHYHGWTWNLDGTLRTAPRWNEQPSFDKDEFPLVPLKLETWGPFIFVNPDSHAAPMSEMLEDLPAMVAGVGLDLNGVTFRRRIEYDIACNWKAYVENFLECYHCPVAHPSFSDMIDIDNYKVVTTHRYFSTQHGGVLPSAKEGKGQGLYDVSEDVLSKGIREGLYAFVWPHFMFAIQPGPPNISTLMTIPVDTHRTISYFDFFFAEDVAETEAAEVVDFLDRVLREDIVLCESVQRGLSSGFFDQGRLMVSRENGIQHFQKLVHSVLTEA